MIYVSDFSDKPVRLESFRGVRGIELLGIASRDQLGHSENRGEGEPAVSTLLKRRDAAMQCANVGS